MSYIKYYVAGWKNFPDTSTPIRAEALENAENGITTAQSTADTAQATADSKPSLGLVIALGG